MREEVGEEEEKEAKFRGRLGCGVFWGNDSKEERVRKAVNCISSKSKNRHIEVFVSRDQIELIYRTRAANMQMPLQMRK